MTRLVVREIIQPVGTGLVPWVESWEMSFVPGLGALVMSVSVCA